MSDPDSLRVAADLYDDHGFTEAAEVLRREADGIEHDPGPAKPIPDEGGFNATIGLSVRHMHALANAGIVTVDELCQLTWRDVVLLRGIGDYGLRDIENGLKRIGRELAIDRS